MPYNKNSFEERERLMATTQTMLKHWIQGREETSRSGRDAEVTNPATGEVVTRVPCADAEEVDAAVQAAVAAAPAWETASLSERTRIMFAFRELLHERRDEMARLVTLVYPRGKVVSSRWPQDAETKIDLAFPTAT